MTAQFLKQYTNQTISILLIVLCIIVGCTSAEKITPPDEAQEKAFDDFKDQVTLIIEDQKRRTLILETVDVLEINVNALVSEMSKRKLKFKALNANYHTTREEFDAALTETSSNLQLHRKTISSQHRLLHSFMTTAEQKKLNRYNSDLIKSFVNSLKSA